MHGNIEQNVEYARKCVRDSLSRNEAPGILRDEISKERQWGIDAGLAWKKVADYSVVYTDLGITKGMEYGINAAKEAGIEVIYRKLGITNVKNS